MSTRARLLTINCRRSTYKPDALFPSRRWSNRRPYMAQFLKRDDVSPSVIAVQECTGRQVTDITHDLGAHWTFWGEPSNRQVLWDTRKWDVLDHKAQVIQSKSEQEATHVLLQRRETGATLWVTSVHLTVGDTNQQWRNLEIREVIKYLKNLPGSKVSVIAGDLNDSSRTSGVRQIAYEHGYKALREKTSNDEITGESYSTFNGWRRTPTTARWLDDILMPATVNPYAGGVRLDCLRIYDICGSDHNGLLAHIEF